MPPHMSSQLMALFTSSLMFSSWVYFTYQLLGCIGKSWKLNSINFSILTLIIFNLYWINICLFGSWFIFDGRWMFNTLKIVFLCTFFCNFPIRMSIKVLCLDGGDVTHITWNMKIKVMSLRCIFFFLWWDKTHITCNWVFFFSHQHFSKT